MLLNLQALRAFAALGVVLFHILIKSDGYGQEVDLLNFARGFGKNGVDIFFVISGFVMVYTQSRNPKTAPVFLANRILRVVPIYWALTFVIFALYLVEPSLFRKVDPSLEHTIKSLFFMSLYLTEKLPSLNVGWSLEYEMMFYLLFAAGLLFRQKIVEFWFPIVMIVGLVVIANVHSIAIEFVFGMLCAKVYLRGLARSQSWMIFLCGALALVYTSQYTSDALRFLLWGVPSALIVFGAAGMVQTKSSFLAYLGAASYSIYLCQEFSIPGFYKVSSSLLPDANGDLLAILCLLATAVLGCLIHEFMEKPLVKLCRKVPWRLPRLSNS